MSLFLTPRYFLFSCWGSLYLECASLGPGEMTQLLRVLFALPEALGVGFLTPIWWLTTLGNFSPRGPHALY